MALDEAHEMRINKDAKLAVVRPSPEKMSFMSNYLSFRSACVRNLSDQLFPEQKERADTFSHRPSGKDKRQK